MEQVPCPAVSGVLHVHVADDLIIDGGTWEGFAEAEADIASPGSLPTTPMFQQVAKYLEGKAVPKAGKFRRDLESRRAAWSLSACGGVRILRCDPSRRAASDIEDDGTATSLAMKFWRG